MTQHSGNGLPLLSGGPWVNVAAICRRLDQGGPDGVILVGVHNGATIAIPEAARSVARFEVDAEVFIVLTFADGTPGSSGRIRIDTDGEDGQRRQGQPGPPAAFDAEGILRLPITLKIAFWGAQRYWFNILLDGKLITRIPYAVRYDYLSTEEMARLAQEGPHSE